MRVKPAITALRNLASFSGNLLPPNPGSGRSALKEPDSRNITARSKIGWSNQLRRIGRLCGMRLKACGGGMRVR